MARIPTLLFTTFRRVKILKTGQGEDSTASFRLGSESMLMVF